MEQCLSDVGAHCADVIGGDQDELPAASKSSLRSHRDVQDSDNGIDYEEACENDDKRAQTAMVDVCDV